MTATTPRVWTDPEREKRIRMDEMSNHSIR
jgi:hypothetical protein